MSSVFVVRDDTCITASSGSNYYYLIIMLVKLCVMLLVHLGKCFCSKSERLGDT